MKLSSMSRRHPNGAPVQYKLANNVRLDKLDVPENVLTGRNALIRDGFDTVGKLRRANYWQLSSSPNVGPMTIAVMRELIFETKPR